MVGILLSNNSNTFRSPTSTPLPPPAASWHIQQYFNLKYLAIHNKIELKCLKVFDLHLICSMWVYFVTHFDALRAVRRTVHWTVLTREPCNSPPDLEQRRNLCPEIAFYLRYKFAVTCSVQRLDLIQ